MKKEYKIGWYLWALILAMPIIIMGGLYFAKIIDLNVSTLFLSLYVVLGIIGVLWHYSSSSLCGFFAVWLALVLRSLTFEPYNIPSGSMFPTLLIGDHLFISKFSYGYSRHSFPFSLPIIPHGRVFEKMPKIGDVVVFRVTPEMIPNLQTSVDYIKRIVALPGDTIQMKEGRLYINGVMAEREFVKKEEIEIEGKKAVYSRYVETLPNGVKHDIYEVDDMVAKDDTPLITVPEGYFFAMGDNRDNSFDSRFFGAVPLTHLEGKAEFIFYSNNGKGFFFEFWRWPEFVRTERIFNKIK